MSECGFREASKKNWNPTNPTSAETIKLGALLRIADALEVIQINYAQLVADRDWHKKRLDSEKAENKTLYKKVAGLRGAYKRLKCQKK